jgi:hypothetical protein
MRWKADIAIGMSAFWGEAEVIPDRWNFAL